VRMALSRMSQITRANFDRQQGLHVLTWTFQSDVILRRDIFEARRHSPRSVCPVFVSIIRAMGIRVLA